MTQREEVVVRSGFSGGQLLLGFLLGAAAGGIAAILYAPQSGEQTRTRIRRLAEGSRERVQRIPEALADATEAAKEAFAESMADEVEPPPRRGRFAKG